MPTPELVPTPPLSESRPADVDAAALAAVADVREEAVGALGAKRRELTWTFVDGPFGSTDVVISIPPARDEAARFPS